MGLPREIGPRSSTLCVHEEVLPATRLKVPPSQGGVEGEVFPHLPRLSPRPLARWGFISVLVMNPLTPKCMPGECGSITRGDVPVSLVLSILSHKLGSLSMVG
jgi:hypothetical protein